MTKTDCLKNLFQYFYNENIGYCVVGDSSELPKVIPSDIDIVIDSNSFVSILILMKNFAKQHDLWITQCLKHECVAYYFTISWKSKSGEMLSINPDICSSYYRNGRKYLDADELINSCIEAVGYKGELKGFNIPAPCAEFSYYFAKKIDKGELTSKHVTHLKDQWRSDPAGSSMKIHRLFPCDISDEIVELISTGNWSSIVQRIEKYRNSLHSHNTIKINDRLRDVKRKIGRIFNPTGLCVVFLGPDGSGKSSVIDEVLPVIEPLYRKKKYIHLRPKLGYNDSRSSGQVTNPHAQEPRSIAVSLLKIIYFFFDYTFGYFLKIRPMLVRSTCVVFDRYYYDLLVDPRRYRYGAPMSFASLVGKLIPKPDLIILLDAPADVLQKRKQEVPYQESSRQRDEYLKLVQIMDNGVVIDASQPLDKVASDVVETIIEKMASKTKNNLGL